MSFGKRIAWLKDQKQKKSNLNKKIVLFDMDGTLTEPRGLFDLCLLSPLQNILKKANIGIVTGSDHDYLIQQMKPILDTKTFKSIHLLPCNGTKHYLPNGDDHKLVHSKCMKSELGELNFKNLMITLLNKQTNIEHHTSPLPLTGHFISYRGSMINWCPIGRNATKEERKTFVKYDTNRTPTYRSILLGRLKEVLSLQGLSDKIVVKFGGDTSFDIYPKGWDKTYCLRHFEDYEVWFVGDRCDAGGNDKELFDLLSKEERSFKTKDTKNTKLIIEDRILPYL